MKEEIENAKRELAKLGAVKDLVGTPGWAVVYDHFKQVISVLTDAVVGEEDFKKVRRLQERLRAFKSMLETVEALCEQYSVDLLKLEEMEQDNNERDQYGLDS